MTFRKKVFVSQKITLLLGRQELKVQALVSEYGAKYVFAESEAPEALKETSLQSLEVLYKNIPVRCRVVRETTAAGTVLSLRFVNPSNLLLRQIERDIRESGLPSPWLRSLPRLSTGVKHLPVPALAILEYGGDTLFLNVKNFTLGGLQFEFVGTALNEVAFGTRLNFDLVTNGGEKISDLSAIVCHVSSEQDEQDEKLSRVCLGVRFLPMNSMSEYKYKSLIKEHCVGLKEAQV